MGTQRRQAISDGIARKKSEQAAKEAERNAATAKPDGSDKADKSESPAIKVTDDVKKSA